MNSDGNQLYFTQNICLSTLKLFWACLILFKILSLQTFHNTLYKVFHMLLNLFYYLFFAIFNNSEHFTSFCNFQTWNSTNSIKFNQTDVVFTMQLQKNILLANFVFNWVILYCRNLNSTPCIIMSRRTVFQKISKCFIYI